jgi:inosine-uridine nucleoside N-ribohydrolase
VPLDATDYVTVTTDFYQRQMKERLTPSAEFVYRVLMKKDPWIRVGEFHFWDPLAAVLLTDESQASYQQLSLKVIEEEGPASGQTLVSAEGQPVRVAMKAELPRFETLFRDTINGKLK